MSVYPDTINTTTSDTLYRIDDKAPNDILSCSSHYSGSPPAYQSIDDSSDTTYRPSKISSEISSPLTPKIFVNGKPLSTSVDPWSSDDPASHAHIESQSPDFGRFSQFQQGSPQTFHINIDTHNNGPKSYIRLGAETAALFAFGSTLVGTGMVANQLGALSAAASVTKKLLYWSMIQTGKSIGLSP